MRGTKTLLDFATHCSYMNVFVYCSTAFCQANRPENILEERIYPAPVDPTKVLSMSKEELKVKTMEVFSDEWPNTYTWTKAVAEVLVASYNRFFPIVIIRPSIGENNFCVYVLNQSVII